jgi:hypothetical protein
MRLILLLSVVVLTSCDCAKASCGISDTVKEIDFCERLDSLYMDNKHDICLFRYWKEAVVIPCSVVHQCIAEKMK